METKYCKDCTQFTTLYIRCGGQINLYMSGKCFKQQNLVYRYACCESWQKADEQETITPRVLRRIVNDLEAIKQILQEETERINKK